MEIWMWIIGIALMIGGLLFGIFVGRSGTDSVTYKAKVKELESELRAQRDEFAGYRDEVTSHFRTTAELVNQMTQSYRAVYHHLAAGSQELCNSEIALEHLSDSQEALPKAAQTEAVTAKKPEPASAKAKSNGAVDAGETQSEAVTKEAPKAATADDARMYH